MTPGLDSDIVAAASAAQREAADPRYSVFVEANAGSGKTRVLVDRVARLLLQGARPDRILCVTFTKAAAGEMQTRLFRKLGDWSTLPDAALKEELERLSGGEPGDLGAARRLFARALETPGGLKIQTLHAYCESLLRRFPLEAGVPPGFATQEEPGSQRARSEALSATLGQAAGEPDGPLADAVADLLEGGGPSAPETLAGFVASKRHAFRRALEAAGSVEALMDAASDALGVDPQMGEEEAKARGWAEAGEGNLEAALSAFDSGTSKRDQESALRLGAALDCGETDPVAAFDAYCELLLTKQGELKAPTSIYTQTLGKTYSILVTLFGPEGDERHRMQAEALPLVRQARANTMSRAAVRFAAAFLDAYEARLAARRALDFADLVEHARTLLSDSEARDWALYKLDQGLDHVLVDEAQDTAPEQWAVIAAITEEFFAGEGAAHDGVLRTVFCVGDEKQSIYSFQNADPRRFIAERLRLEARADEAGLEFRRPPLDVSFRSSAEVLEAVDRAFAAERHAIAAPERKDVTGALETKFLMSDPETAEARDPLAFHRYEGHRAARKHTPGCVEIWPATPKPAAVEDEDLELAPVDAPQPESARNRLAEAVAQEIHDLLARGDRVWEEAKPEWIARAARPGDIVVLVRKRGGLFEEIIRRLKLKGVPVAGADRMTLADQLVVEDLVSLAKFALLPEDDLSLAEVLKSPFFHPAGAEPAIDDDALFDLTRRPETRLWDKLRATDDPRFAEAREALDRARARVDADAPYAFFASFLEEASATGESRLARLYARLGEEARDPAEEFLSRALAHERDGAPSLARFIAAIEGDAAQIKREMEAGRGEVRVMTVHAAKGLEAPIVFLPDTTQTPNGRSNGLYAHDDAGLVWTPDPKSPPPLVKSLQEVEELAQDGEYQRLLYVALTRARDRLVVCGHVHGRGEGKIDAGCWLDRVQRAWRGEDWRAVRTALHDVADAQAWDVEPALRFGEDPPALKPAEAAAETAPPLPAWAKAAAPEEPRRTRAVAPSHLIAEEEGGFEPAPLSPLAPGGEARFRRGALIHKLLQTLPDLPEARRAESATRYLAAQPELSDAQREEIRDETLAVLDHPEFAPIFGPGSRAEVALAGAAPDLPDGVTVNGQIDRLVVTDHAVLIVDYKTNRPPPERVEDVAPAYLGQMAAYRALMRVLHPDKPVRCALLWTDGPRLMELPEDRLDAALAAARA
ncbi:UvrD-helicase domain-containing protein [Marinicauda salina]|nr:UvrD-helicase domain-containing protein [Marinicauda salina]